MHNHPRFEDTLISLGDTNYEYQKTSLSQKGGEFLWKLITENNYKKTIETGCALGVSSLYICDAISKNSSRSHTIVDPSQGAVWSNIGVRNLQARSVDYFTLLEEPSEIALPKLLENKEIFDFGFIDGWHTFDHTLIDFFYLNRLIKVGGMIVFDDANWASVSKLLRYLSQYPAYELVFDEKDGVIEKSTLLKKHSDLPFPPVVGLKKIAEDLRRWDWYEDF